MKPSAGIRGRGVPTDGGKNDGAGIAPPSIDRVPTGHRGSLRGALPQGQEQGQRGGKRTATAAAAAALSNRDRRDRDAGGFRGGAAAKMAGWTMTPPIDEPEAPDVAPVRDNPCRGGPNTAPLTGPGKGAGAPGKPLPVAPRAQAGVGSAAPRGLVLSSGRRGTGSPPRTSRQGGGAIVPGRVREWSSGGGAPEETELLPGGRTTPRGAAGAHGSKAGGRAPLSQQQQGLGGSNAPPAALVAGGRASRWF